MRNEKPANLYLMNRADLHSAFTKINLWKQTQFRKIVYLDADVVAYRAPDELFDLDQPFSAAPDIGWPDLFNTGVMALSPNLGDYYALAAMAERGISFDGADQGLLNMHFKNNYNRLSFTYNVTPSGHYQYVPAYRHFQSSINMVHFIGSDKPWALGREASSGSSPYDEMLGRWWAVYDRHYRQPVSIAATLAGLSTDTDIQDSPLHSRRRMRPRVKASTRSPRSSSTLSKANSVRKQPLMLFRPASHRSTKVDPHMMRIIMRRHHPRNLNITTTTTIRTTTSSLMNITIMSIRPNITMRSLSPETPSRILIYPLPPPASR